MVLMQTVVAKSAGIRFWMDSEASKQFSKAYVWDLIQQALNGTNLEDTNYGNEGGFLHDSHLILTKTPANLNIQHSEKTVTFKATGMEVAVLTGDFHHSEDILILNGRILTQLVNVNLLVTVEALTLQNSISKLIPTLKMTKCELTIPPQNFSISILSNQLGSILDKFYPDYTQHLFPKMMANLETKVQKEFDQMLTVLTSYNPGVIKYPNGLILNMNLIDDHFQVANNGIEYFKFDFDGIFNKSLRDQAPTQPLVFPAASTPSTLSLQLYPDFFESFINTVFSGQLNYTEQLDGMLFNNGQASIVVARFELLKNF